MIDLNAAITGFLFRLDQLEAVDYFDILLVTIFIYLVFALLRRSQAAFLVRGLIVLAMIFLFANLLLPLPTFGLILSIALLAILITVTITLQPELRRWLEQFGRRFGFAISSQHDVAEQVVSPVTRTAEGLSSKRTGALIVLEGNSPLTEIISSGVPVNGQVSSELLQTIFFDKTPLHDGAVVIRGSEVVAAGCVLPLTERDLRGQYRLGTRHRAALGMSEVSDAFIIVVSEETGTISVTQNGQLDRGLDRPGLHQRLLDFYAKTAETQPISQWKPWQNWHIEMPTMHRILANLGYLFISFLLALAAATAVRQQSDPFENATMENVSLDPENQPADVALTSLPPQTVSIDYRATKSEIAALSPSSFQATVDLSDVVEGANRLPVEVSTAADKVLIIGPQPAQVDVTVASIISRTMPITVRIEDVDQLSAAYEVRGEASVVPEVAVITGAEPDVERVVVVGTAISVADATTTVQETRPLLAFDVDENEVDGIIIDPDEVDVSVSVRRRVDARDVGVRPVTMGAPPDEYWLSGLSVEPANVTLQGNPGTIAELGGFLDTMPVDLSDAYGVKVQEVPLDLPPDVQALDNSGDVIGTVTVTADVEPLSGDLLVARPVELINDRGTLTVTLEPPAVSLLLSGPLPTLNEIEANPELVRVVIDALELEPNQSIEVVPDVIAPEGIRTRSIESSVLVTTTP